MDWLPRACDAIVVPAADYVTLELEHGARIMLTGVEAGSRHEHPAAKILAAPCDECQAIYYDTRR